MEAVDLASIDRSIGHNHTNGEEGVDACERMINRQEGDASDDGGVRQQASEHFVHSGTLASARMIAQDITTRTVLHRALAKHPEWHVVVVGHSLGGSVASILTLLLKPSLPSLRGWAIDPAGFTCSPLLARHLSNFVTSVVHADDWAPRLSLCTLQALLHQVSEHSGNIQGTFREHSGDIQGTFREHSGNIQGTVWMSSTNQVNRQ
jgi:pimeloyl-ACP methyl ester carboxylesterase